ncbi:MAG: cytochrome C biogenesis protein [Alphaproteobacteria bacterium HGW-Alphaproteobacteria-2]|nr:MAG: cytochrome C biogenesis protein [Alphaproteobacteria bacterium HGW-Alphaproteobacteria-2]
MFGIDIFDATLLPAMFVAALAGLLSFLSPCVLPIVPPYLAYMGGVSLAEATGQGGAALRVGPNGAAIAVPRARRSVALAALFFVLGLSTVFLFLGFTASTLGQLFLRHQEIMAQVAGVVIVVFGLHFLHVFRIPFLDREARLDAGDRGGSALGAYVLGLAFAFGWTPCIGPILGAILSLAAQESSVARGTVLLGTYALGLGIPFLLAALFLHRAMGVMAFLKRNMRMIERVSGVMLLIVGVMLITGAFTDLAFWLLETFPALALLG